MTRLLLVLLALVSLVCVLVLAVGGRRGLATTNPWWSLLAAVNLVLTLHVLGYYLPNVRWVPWAALVATLVSAVPAGLRERDLWLQELTRQPRDTDHYVEIALFFLAVLTAYQLQPYLPNAHRVSLVILAFIPLFLARWAATRLRRSQGSRP